MIPRIFGKIINILQILKGGCKLLTSTVHGIVVHPHLINFYERKQPFVRKDLALPSKQLYRHISRSI